MLHRHRLGGLQLASAFALEGFPRWPADDLSLPDMVIRIGRVPENLAGADVRLRNVEARRGEEILLRFPGIMRVLVRGNEAIVAPVADADPDMIAIGLLGKVQAALWYRRGLLPLHGSALAVGGRAVVILGRSGAGKSTLAATLAPRINGMVVGDDTCVINVADGGGGEVWPNTSVSRLLPDAVRALGVSPEGLVRAPGSKGKCHMGDPNEVTSSPLPLALMIALDTDNEVSQPRVQPLTLFQSVAMTFVNMQKPTIGKALHPQSHLFSMTARLCEGVPMVRALRPRSPNGDRTALAALAEQAIAAAMA